MRLLLKLLAFCSLVTGAPAHAATCPLEGTWDTGFLSEFGHGFTRVTLAFDCGGHATMTAYNTRGKLVQSTAAIIERQGAYQVVGASSAPAGALDVDVKIESLTMQYLDPMSVDMEHRGNLTCRGQAARILEKFSVAGLECNGAKFPPLGFVERGVAKIEGDVLYWSALHGAEAVVVQAPNAALARKPSVDVKLAFRKRILP